MNDFALGWSQVRPRLGGKWAAFSGLLATTAVVLAASVERRFVPSRAVDDTLSSVVFGLCIPLLSYSVMARVSAYGRLDDAIWPFARFGANRRRAALGLVGGASVATGTFSAALAALGVLVAAGVSSASVHDAFTSAWIAALGGCAYSGFFALGSLFGRHGGGRFAALCLDWIFGSGATALAAPWPRAHLQSLLGGDLVVSLSERESNAALCVLLFSYAVVCFFRMPA